MLRMHWSRAALVGILVLGLSIEARSAGPKQGAAVSRSGSTGAAPAGPTILADPPAGQLLSQAAAQQSLVGQVIEREVEAALLHAQQTLADDPAAATDALRSNLHLVCRSPELSAELRAALRGRLEVALHSATRRAAEFEERQLAVQQARAAAAERTRVAGQLASQQQRIEQLAERFGALMNEGRYGLAESVASQLDGEPSPDGTLAATSLQGNVRLIRAVLQSQEQRRERQDKIVRALGLVESAGTAFPDDEPIVYPEAEVWQALTVRRAKSSRTDLHEPSRATARITQALKEPTSYDFTEVSLRDAVEYLKDLHGIEIQFDAKALEASGIDLETPVTQKLAGVSLRLGLAAALGALGPDVRRRERGAAGHVRGPGRAQNRQPGLSRGRSGPAGPTAAVQFGLRAPRRL